MGIITASLFLIQNKHFRNRNTKLIIIQYLYKINDTYMGIITTSKSNLNLRILIISNYGNNYNF